jgi:hypothetical protein
MRLDHGEGGHPQSMTALEGVYEPGGMVIDDAAGGTAHDHPDDSGFQQPAVAVSHDKAQQGER